MVDRGYGGLLMFDPLNIRYATDSTNMQLWNTHNPFRAVLVCADGYMVMWDYKNAPFLSEFNPLVRERRSGASMFYFANGDKVPTNCKLEEDGIIYSILTYTINRQPLATEKEDGQRQKIPAEEAAIGTV